MRYGGMRNNEKQMAILDKEFVVDNHFSISRADYESMPCAMLAWNWSDEKMQELADRIDARLGSDYPNEFEMEDDFWQTMEDEAIRMGMEYYEDMTDERIAELDNEWSKIK